MIGGLPADPLIEASVSGSFIFYNKKTAHRAGNTMSGSHVYPHKQEVVVFQSDIV